MSTLTTYVSPIEELLADRRRDRLPAAQPAPGQQYAFRVDLDTCTGCKSCVAACHTLKGLEEGEIWRRTGTMHGHDAAGPVLRTVTASCHHCVDPACMRGCPAEAYRKDPVTGIVVHLDDSCIGCRYCTLMCPYEVPDYRPSLGIVRKCDMCSDRLEAGDAPSCVQSCPTGAITITLVDVGPLVSATRNASEPVVLVPGAPPSALTVPTTVYVSAPRVRARSAERVGSADRAESVTPVDPIEPVKPVELSDAAAVLRCDRAHPPLEVMLVLTQVAVGAYLFHAWSLLGAASSTTSEGAAGARVGGAFVGLGAGLVALAASVLHLGRPERAWRAVLGIRHSWLSREIVAFAVFALAAMADAALSLLDGGQGWRNVMAAVVVVSGVAGIGCSVALYAVTGRRWWASGRTAARFGATTVLGGVLVYSTLHAVGAGPWDSHRWILVAGVGALFASFAADLGGCLLSTQSSPQELRRTGSLLRGPLRSLLEARVACALIGVVLLPAMAFVQPAGDAPAVVLAVATAVAVLGELVERRLFFVAVAAPRMPGEPP